jgi:hypothetical protein
VDRSELPFSSFVLERYKIVYVPIAKASTTSMKWLVATLNGEKEANFRKVASAQTTRAATIHNRGAWKRTPTLEKIPAETLSQVHPDNGWFIFAVTRHPTSRLWSAWQSKFLLRQEIVMKQYRQWVPRVPTSTSDVLEDFEAFAVALQGPGREKIMANRHFQDQTSLLGSTPYSRIYTTSEIPQLLQDLGAHVKANGGPELPDLILSNDTPLPLIEPVLTPTVLAAVEDLYHDDMTKLGFPDVRPYKVDPASEYTAAQLREVGRLVERSDRVSDLSTQTQRLQRKLAQARKAARKSGGTSEGPAGKGKGKGRGRSRGGKHTGGNKAAPANGS